jgi:shikimate dehydrogenase
MRVVARRREQVEALESVGRVEFFPWTRLGLMQASENCRLILNCTPLGMAPEADASPWLETVSWPPRAFAYDLVYNPPETRFVHQARRAGLRAATGLGMLVEQGALAFELWTRRVAPRDLMRQAAETALAH